MAGQTSDDLLAVFDRAPLNARYWTSFALLGGVYVLDFFDFFLIAFILAVIGPSWHLTYGQSALILYGSGLGAILGSLIWGSLGDVFGRKMQTVTVTVTLICGVSAGFGRAVDDRQEVPFPPFQCRAPFVDVGVPIVDGDDAGLGVPEDEFGDDGVHAKPPEPRARRGGSRGSRTVRPQAQARHRAASWRR